MSPAPGSTDPLSSLLADAVNLSSAEISDALDALRTRVQRTASSPLRSMRSSNFCDGAMELTAAPPDPGSHPSRCGPFNARAIGQGIQHLLDPCM